MEKLHRVSNALTALMLVATLSGVSASWAFGSGLGYSAHTALILFIALGGIMASVLIRIPFTREICRMADKKIGTWNLSRMDFTFRLTEHLGEVNEMQLRAMNEAALEIEHLLRCVRSARTVRLLREHMETFRRMTYGQGNWALGCSLNKMYESAELTPPARPTDP